MSGQMLTRDSMIIVKPIFQFSPESKGLQLEPECPEYLPKETNHNKQDAQLNIIKMFTKSY